MRQNISQRKLLLGLLVLVLAIAGLWVFKLRPATLPPERLAEDVQLPEPAELPDEIMDAGLFPESDQDLDPVYFENEPLNSKPPATAEVTNAPVRPLSEEEKAYRAEFEGQLALAMAGDDSLAVEVGLFINACSEQFSSASTVERSIKFAARRFADGKPLPKRFGGSSAMSIENLETFEQFQRESFRRCESFRDLFNNDFWEVLQREADNGNPTARYLYATLQRPPEHAALNFNGWDEALEHNERVYEYTWKNMSDREPLGILAMAQNLPSNSRSAYNRFSTTAVLTTAAVKCGLQSNYLDQQLDNWFSHFESIQTQYPDVLTQLNEASDEVKRMFCK